MKRLKKVGKWLGITVGVLLVAMLGLYGWASSKVSSIMEETYEAHEMDFPIPFPLSDAELDELRAERAAELAPEEPEEEAPEVAKGEAAETEAEEGEEAPEVEAPEPVDPLEGVDLDAIALERAVERGEHLVNALYVCVECHGDDFSGGVMVDDPAIGTWLGPNLTGGEGSRVADWTAAQWDQAVRHGILPGGRASAMPAEDYQRMSDRELSDIIAYIRSFPAVDNQVAEISFGPVGTVLMATGEIPLSVNAVDHDAPHAEQPPEARDSVEYGEHLAAVCTGCHRSNLEGGPMPFGPPDWVAARNLTPHDEGLADWEFDDFAVAMREMKRPDGTALQMPMSMMQRYTGNLTETEMRALWTYLQSLEPKPTGT